MLRCRAARQAEPMFASCLIEFVRQRDPGRREILPQMRQRRGAGDQQDIGRAAQQPGKRDLHGRGAEACSDGGQVGGLQRAEPAERKVRHVGDAVAGELVDQGVVGPLRQVVMVLHADDFAEPASLGDLRRRDMAEPDVAHQPLALQLGEDRERRLDRPLRGMMGVEHAAKVDQFERIQPQIAQIVLHRLDQFVARKGRIPGSIRTAPRADLGDDDEIVGIGVQRFADQLIGEMRSVEVAGVDVVDAGGDGLPQHGEGRAAIFRRPEHAGAGELHGAIAEPPHRAAAEWKGAGTGDI